MMLRSNFVKLQFHFPQHRITSYNVCYTKLLRKDTKCIILSNQSEPADKEAAAKLGAVGYIVKAEMLPSEVVEEVHSIVGKK